MHLRHQVKRRRFEVGVLGAVKIAHVHVESPHYLLERSVRVELHIEQAGAEWRGTQVREKLFQIEVLRLKGDQYFAIGGKKRTPGA